MRAMVLERQQPAAAAPLRLRELAEPAPGPGEILVSSTVKDLVVGSGLEFSDRGPQKLKGVPGQWHLFSVNHP